MQRSTLCVCVMRVVCGVCGVCGVCVSSGVMTKGGTVVRTFGRCEGSG
jgi:hypothetical protein